jgi:hypothetical protein
VQGVEYRTQNEPPDGATWRENKTQRKKHNYDNTNKCCLSPFDKLLSIGSRQAGQTRSAQRKARFWVKSLTIKAMVFHHRDSEVTEETGKPGEGSITIKAMLNPTQSTQSGTKGVRAKSKFPTLLTS